MRWNNRGTFFLLGAAWCLAASASSQSSPEEVLLYSVLDNGDLSAAPAIAADESGILRLPWWRSPRGSEHLEQDSDGKPWLVTLPGESISQPIPCYLPLLPHIRIQGVVRGTGQLVLRDAHGAQASFPWDGDPSLASEIRLTWAELAPRLSDNLLPRLELCLQGGDGGARWRALDVQIALPLPTPASLRAEILAELERDFAYWLPRDLDREGPRHTAFLAWQHDVITGERLQRLRVTCHPLYLLLGRALNCAERPDWRTAYEAFLSDYLELGLHPLTGIPRNFDTERDQGDDERALEISQALGFLIDVAESGPPSFRERARAAAFKIGETVLARGRLPDGSIAARYRPLDGAPNTDTPPLRALDMPAQLGRLAQLCADSRFLLAAQQAVRRFEFTHYWAGSWEYLDPGFDDHYGHFGARGLVLWRAHGSTPSFRRIALSGLEYYAPRWHEAVRLGGYIAADEVRCWPIATGIAALEPSWQERVSAVLRDAVRAHFKAEQFPDASWGDVTYYNFDPKISLEVGDLPAIPQNLLFGLASAYRANLGPTREETRAMFSAILRQTQATFRREHGYLSTRGERSGQNPAGGSIRLASSLVEMLEALQAF